MPASGALDGPLRDLLNRLLGNRADAAVLETLGGLVVRADRSRRRRDVRRAGRDDRSAPATRSSVEPAAGDLWGYLAVRGGIDVPPVLGSRSTDSRSGLGPPVVVDGADPPDR